MVPPISMLTANTKEELFNACSEWLAANPTHRLRSFKEFGKGGFQAIIEVIPDVERTTGLDKTTYNYYQKQKSLPVATYNAGVVIIEKTDISAIVNLTSIYKAKLLNACLTAFGTSASLILDCAIFFFSSDPTLSTLTVGNTVAVNAADRDKLIGITQVNASGVTISTTLKHFASSGSRKDEIVIPVGTCYIAVVHTGGTAIVAAGTELDLVLNFEIKNNS